MSVVTANRAIPDRAGLKEAILRHVTYSLGMNPKDLAPREAFRAVALAARDLAVERLLATEQRFQSGDAKRLYYLSLEFLIGRSLHNNLTNLGLLDTCRAYLSELGIDLHDVEEQEADAAL